MTEKFDKVFGDHIHQNDGSHLNGGVSSDKWWKKQWIEQCYFYPQELKKDLENIYNLSVDNPKDGINIYIDDEYPNRQGPTVVMTFEDYYKGPKSEEIMEELSKNDPKIYVGGGLNDGHAFKDEIYIIVHSLEEIDIEIIAEKLNEIIE